MIRLRGPGIGGVAVVPVMDTELEIAHPWLQRERQRQQGEGSHWLLMSLTFAKQAGWKERSNRAAGLGREYKKIQTLQGSPQNWQALRKSQVAMDSDFPRVDATDMTIRICQDPTNTPYEVPLPKILPMDGVFQRQLGPAACVCCTALPRRART